MEQTVFSRLLTVKDRAIIMERLQVISHHLTAARNVVAETSASEPPRFRFSPDDVVVVSALRTPIGKSRKGVFKVK